MKVFPLTVEQYNGPKTAQGMELRDHFAGLAMQGLLSARASVQIDFSKETLKKDAILCYEIADAMMEVRKPLPLSKR